jgi:hypothetical protein
MPSLLRNNNLNETITLTKQREKASHHLLKLETEGDFFFFVLN